VNDGSRVGLDEGVGYFFAADFRSGITTARENWNPFLGIVRIRCQHVDGVVLEQP
jgi:hypothetical protein